MNKLISYSGCGSQTLILNRFKNTCIQFLFNYYLLHNHYLLFTIFFMYYYLNLHEKTFLKITLFKNKMTMMTLFLIKAFLQAFSDVVHHVIEYVEEFYWFSSRFFLDFHYCSWSTLILRKLHKKKTHTVSQVNGDAKGDIKFPSICINITENTHAHIWAIWFVASSCCKNKISSFGPCWKSWGVKNALSISE